MYNLSKISWLKTWGGWGQNNNSREWFLGAVPVSSNWWPVSPLSVVGDPLSGEHLVEHLVKTNSTPCSTLGQLGKQIENLLA